MPRKVDAACIIVDVLKGAKGLEEDILLSNLEMTTGPFLKLETISFASFAVLISRGFGFLIVTNTSSSFDSKIHSIAQYFSGLKFLISSSRSARILKLAL